MDYVPKYFEPYELIPKKTYDLLERMNKLYQIWWLFDPRILLAADRLRKKYGKMVANTWWWGGKNHDRGFRLPGCRVGTDRSQHRFGRALDLVPTEYNVDDIRNDIKAGEDFGGITCIEDGVSWLHIDCRNYKGLLIVYP